jgi:hypothetical protein
MFSNEAKARASGSVAGSRLAWTACVVSLLLFDAASARAVVISNSAGVTTSFDATGAYVITSVSALGNFGGSVGQPASNIAVNSGADNLGSYAEISFNYTSSNNAAHLGAIRQYNNQAVILFTDTYLSPSTNDLNFPHFTNYPVRPYYLNYGGLFGLHNFGTMFADSPWLFFDTNYNCYMISPATNFLYANNFKAADNSIYCGIDPAITNFPAGFSHRTMLVIQTGINRTFETWGRAITSLTGKTRVANDAAVELNKLGYWTDHGGTYYYNYDSSKGYIGTLLAVRDEFNSKGVPLGYMQLDSWWYPKGNAQGIYLYVGSQAIFTNGLAAFQQQLGLPLITHSRWIDTTSPYRAQYVFSGGVSIDNGFWVNIMSSIQNAGVVTYEQDWLAVNAVPLENLTDPPAFLNDMSAAAAANGINMQYCMPFPRHYMQGAQYNNLLTMRVCGDRFSSNDWDDFLFDSRFVSALGAWPWCDVFMSSEERNLVLSTLSGGIVGPGDALGAVSAVNLSKAARPDSVLVKPDAALLPIDRAYVIDVQGQNLPLICSTHTDHNGFTNYYVYTYARNSSIPGNSFTPAELGMTGTAFVYDYFNQIGTIVSNTSSFAYNTTMPDNNVGGSYFIVVPIGPSGIAFLGDTNKYVMLGKKRIPRLSDNGVVQATVVFAAGESSVTVSGYAPTMPYVNALGGSVNSLAYDPVRQFFTASVSPDATLSASLVIGLGPVLQITNLSSQFQISWSTSFPGYNLQSATTLQPVGNWTPVTNPIVTQGSQNTVRFVPTNSAMFFRLKH